MSALSAQGCSRPRVALMRFALCACVVALCGVNAQLRPRRVGVNPMGEAEVGAEAGGAEPDMASLMKNMMGGGMAWSKWQAYDIPWATHALDARPFVQGRPPCQRGTPTPLEC